jgi:hypothetical protein
MKLLGLFLMGIGLLLGVVYWLAVKAYCQPRPDGTFGELYGPLTYFKPYVFALVGVALVLGVVFLVVAMFRKLN